MCYWHFYQGTSEKAYDLANSVPSLGITSSSNIPHLNDLDADLNMPLDSNFGFYSTNDFHSNMTSASVY